MPIIPVLRKPMEEDSHKFKYSTVYITIFRQYQGCIARVFCREKAIHDLREGRRKRKEERRERERTMILVIIETW